MRGIFKVLEGVILFYLAFVFMKWYIKGHFGKYFILFWLNTIIALMMGISQQQRIEQEYDHRTGSEIWNEMHR